MNYASLSTFSATAVSSLTLLSKHVEGQINMLRKYKLLEIIRVAHYKSELPINDCCLRIVGLEVPTHRHMCSQSGPKVLIKMRLA